MRRLVSLVPSITETLLAWDVTPLACTRFCEQPDLTHVGGTKNPDIAAIVALSPDVVLMCEEENRREDADALAAAGVATAAVVVESVEDVSGALTMLAALAGVEIGAVPLDGMPTHDPPVRARAFVPIWRRPWMTMSDATYGAALLRRLGIDNVFAGDPTRYPETTLEDAAARQPDVVLAPSEPYHFTDAHVAELSQVAPVVLVDGQDLFWWGARTPVAFGRLAAAAGEWISPADPR